MKTCRVVRLRAFRQIFVGNDPAWETRCRGRRGGVAPTSQAGRYGGPDSLIQQMFAHRVTHQFSRIAHAEFLEYA